MPAGEGTTPSPFSLEVGSETLQGLVSYPDDDGPRPTVCLCHGFKGFMEWGFFPYLAELLRSRGFTVVQFNWTGAGMQPGDELVTDTASFRNATFGRDLEELLELVAATRDGRIAPGRVDPDRLGVLGHSRGGGTAILAAAEQNAVRALVTWNAIATFDRLSAEDTEAWRQSGFLPIVNGRTGQELEIGVEVLVEFEANRKRYDIEAAATRRSCPWLILQGERDETVPVDEAHRLAEAASNSAASNNAELRVVTDADHTFGAVHPFRGPTPHLIEAMNATQQWFRRNLS